MLKFLFKLKFLGFVEAPVGVFFLFHTSIKTVTKEIGQYVSHNDYHFKLDLIVINHMYLCFVLFKFQ